MDPTSNDHQPLEQLESINDLLEDFWFFDNLLDRRSRILRYCHSDPYPFSPSPSSPSLEPVAEKVVEASTEGGDSVSSPCIDNKKPEKVNKMRRQFSEKIKDQEQRSYLQKKELVVREKGIKQGSRRNRACSMGGSLQRTQTLPSYIGREDDDGNEFQDQEESDDSRMGFLIREAIASSSSELTPTKQSIPKISSIPRHRPPRSSRSEEAIQEMVINAQRNVNRKTLRKTLSNVGTKEILTMKESGIDTETKKKEDEEHRRIPRAAVKNRSAAVVGQPVPVWVPKESSRDMKAQIKFWARTVASNVRQEC